MEERQIGGEVVCVLRNVGDGVAGTHSFLNISD